MALVAETQADRKQEHDAAGTADGECDAGGNLDEWVGL